MVCPKATARNSPGNLKIKWQNFCKKSVVFGGIGEGWVDGHSGWDQKFEKTF